MSNATLKSHIQTLSPVVYWPLDEVAGTSFAQIGTSSAGPMTPFGTYSLAAQELLPSDNTKFLQLGAGASASATRGNVTAPFSDISVSFIMRFNPPFDSAVINGPAFGASGETLATNYMLLFKIYPATGLLQDFWEYGAGTDVFVDSTKSLDPRFYNQGVPKNNTFIFTTTRNSATKKAKFYVNGRLFETVSYTTEADGGTSSAAVFTIGSGANVNIVSTGHVCMFNSVLSDAQVYDLASAAGLQDASAGPVFESSVDFDVSVNQAQNVVKALYCAVDPLIDISVAFPDSAYNIE